MRGIFLAAVLNSVFAQPAGQPYAYVAIWTAAHAGQTFVRLELTMVNGTLAGRISLGDIHVNPLGEVDSVLKPAPDFTQIFDVAIRDGALFFARKDDNEIDLFEMRLVDGEARLIFAATEEDRAKLAREGLPLPSPIRLTKSLR